MVYFLGALSSLPPPRLNVKGTMLKAWSKQRGHEIPGEHSKHLKVDISVIKGLVGTALGEFSPAESAHHPAGVG